MYFTIRNFTTICIDLQDCESLPFHGPSAGGNATPTAIIGHEVVVPVSLYVYGIAARQCSAVGIYDLECRLPVNAGRRCIKVPAPTSRSSQVVTIGCPYRV